MIFSMYYHLVNNLKVVNGEQDYVKGKSLQKRVLNWVEVVNTIMMIIKVRLANMKQRHHTKVGLVWDHLVIVKDCLLLFQQKL